MWQKVGGAHAHLSVRGLEPAAAPHAAAAAAVSFSATAVRRTVQLGDADLSTQKLPRVESRGEFVSISIQLKDRLGVNPQGEAISPLGPSRGMNIRINGALTVPLTTIAHACALSQ